MPPRYLRDLQRGRPIISLSPSHAEKKKKKKKKHRNLRHRYRPTQNRRPGVVYPRFQISQTRLGQIAAPKKTSTQRPPAYSAQWLGRPVQKRACSPIPYAGKNGKKRRRWTMKDTPSHSRRSQFKRKKDRMLEKNLTTSSSCGFSESVYRETRSVWFGAGFRRC